MRPVTLATGFSRPDFDALLKSREFALVEALSIKLASGTMLAYTTAQYDITVPPYDDPMSLRTYDCDDVGVSGWKSRVSNGCESQGGSPTTSISVDEMSLTFTPNLNPVAPSVVDGVPFIQALRQRAFDGAVFMRDTWYLRLPDFVPVGGIPRFYGLSSAIDSGGRTQAIDKVKSDIVLLGIDMPRNLFQPNCQYTVYSAGCGADKSSFASHATAGAATNAIFIDWTGASVQFTGGEIEFEAGPAINQVRTILRADGTGLWVSYPFYGAPNPGDAFVAYPGCNRLDPLVNPSTSGCPFFGRQAAFRATPNVPGAVYGI